jgi:DNA polymerase
MVTIAPQSGLSHEGNIGERFVCCLPRRQRYGDAMQALNAEPYVPESRDIAVLRDAVKRCEGCDLYKNATQAVFGAGPLHPQMMLVGEQPGDVEDQDGVPFVGPAGRMLDRALEELAIDRDRLYLTNAVKHFKWKPRGKRRIHETPRASEMRACRPWLEAEIEAVKPRLIVALGATAVGSLLNDQAKVMRDRGRVMESIYGPCLVTVHPSSLLRVEGEDERRAAYRLFLQDLRKGLDFLERAAA